MTGLYILIGIVLFFVFLLSLKAKVKLEFKDELFLTVSVLGITVKKIPGKVKPVDYTEYTYEKHQKRLRARYEAYQKKQEKKALKAENKSKKKAEKKAKLAAETKEEKKARKSAPKRSISDWVSIAVGVLAVLFEKFFGHLRIKVARLKVNVATGDAASTAIMYGAVIQSVAYLLEIMPRLTNIDGLEKAEIEVNPDYLSDKMSLDLCFIFSIRVWHIFDLLFGVLGRAIKKFLATDPKKKAAAELPDMPRRRRRRRKKRKKPTSTTSSAPATTENNKN